MDISLVDLAIEIIFGAIGGYIAGTAMRDLSLGTVGNLIAGAIGGLISGYSLRAATPFLGVPLAASRSASSSVRS
jgi:uncharacterized membrane protein YeaQ/YmgE (transglycosylase-associated protein family)